MPQRREKKHKTPPLDVAPEHSGDAGILAAPASEVVSLANVKEKFERKRPDHGLGPPPHRLPNGSMLKSSTPAKAISSAVEKVAQPDTAAADPETVVVTVVAAPEEVAKRVVESSVPMEQEAQPVELLPFVTPRGELGCEAASPQSLDTPGGIFGTSPVTSTSSATADDRYVSVLPEELEIVHSCESAPKPGGGSGASVAPVVDKQLIVDISGSQGQGKQPTMNVATLTVRVLKAFNLTPASRSLFSNATMDVFVQVQIGRDIKRTLRSSDLNPVWSSGAEFDFEITPDVQSLLTLEVINENAAKNTDPSLGRCHVDLSMAPLGSWYRVGRPLEGGGEGELLFEVRMVCPDEVPKSWTLAWTQPLNEEGYQGIVALGDQQAMATFIRRVVKNAGGTVLSEGDLQGMVPYFSGALWSQCFEALVEELRVCSWVEWASLVRSSRMPPQGARLLPAPTASLPTESLRSRSTRTFEGSSTSSICGPLLKDSGSWLRGWQLRWFELQDGQLRWWDSPEAASVYPQNPNSWVEMRGMSVKYHKQSRTQFHLSAPNCKEKEYYHFDSEVTKQVAKVGWKCSKIPSASEWIKALLDEDRRLTESSKVPPESASLP